MPSAARRHSGHRHRRSQRGPDGRTIVGRTPHNGIVTGSFHGVDADGDALTYTVTTPGKGAVTVTAAGVFTYTPTAAARAAAAATTANDFDTFTVTVKDSRGSSATADVTVEVAPTGSVNQLTLPGLADGVFTADGTHLVRTFSSGTTPATATTQVTVVDVATATQLGQTITLSGYYQVQGFNTNDTRAVLKGTFAYPDDTVGIAVINVESGAQVGETMLLTRPTGDQNNTSTVSLSADRNLVFHVATTYDPSSSVVVVTIIDASTGTTLREIDRSGYGTTFTGTSGHRAVVATVTYDAAAGVFATQFDVINTLDGTSHDLTIPGLWSTVNLNPAGTRASLLGTLDLNNTAVASLDLVNGVQLGETVTPAADLNGTATYSNGTLAAVAGFSAMGSTYTTSLAIIDPVTGVPHLLALDGYPVTTAVDSTGTRLVQTVVDAAGGCSLYVVDTSAAAQVGTPVVLAGSTYNLATQFTSDGKFAAQTTFEDATGTTRVVVVNTATGAQVGSTFTTTGGVAETPAGIVLGGTRVFQFITHFDSSHARVSVDVIVIDPATGTQVGNTLSLDGFVNGGKFNEDGSRYTLIGYEPPSGGAMGSATLVVLDTETGAHVGDTYTSTFPGLVFQTYFTPDGTRVILPEMTIDPVDGAVSTTVRLVDTATGTEIAEAIEMPGMAGAVLTPDGLHAAYISETVDGTLHTSRVVFVDTTTGAQFGNALNVSGTAFVTAFTADGGAIVRVFDTVAQTTTYVTFEPD